MIIRWRESVGISRILPLLLLGKHGGSDGDKFFRVHEADALKVSYGWEAEASSIVLERVCPDLEAANYAFVLDGVEHFLQCFLRQGDPLHRR